MQAGYDSPYCSCYCDVCSYTVNVSGLRPKRVATADKARARRLERALVEQMANEGGARRSTALYSALQRSTALYDPLKHVCDGNAVVLGRVCKPLPSPCSVGMLGLKMGRITKPSPPAPVVCRHALAA